MHDAEIAADDEAEGHRDCDERRKNEPADRAAPAGRLGQTIALKNRRQVAIAG
jgi:hypothetical protein